MFGVAFPEKKLIRANRYAGLVVAKNHTANCQCILPTESPLSGQKLGEAFGCSACKDEPPRLCTSMEEDQDQDWT